MDNERALTILNKAYDTLESLEGFEVREVDPFEKDAMDRWQRLRAQSREPAPQPRQAKLDTQAARDASQARWDAWADSRIEAYLLDVYNGAVGEAIEERCHVHRDKLLTKIAELRHELELAQKKIEKLEARSKASEQGRVIGWELDRSKYRAIPFYADGPGFPINLRPLFEQFFEEAGIGSKE